MGKYDIVSRRFFSDLDRTAELFSVGVHRKRLSVKGGDLVMTEGKYPSLSGYSGQYERDGLFVCPKCRVKYALELEKHADFGMPRRVLTYDACEYERQTEKLESRNGKNRSAGSSCGGRLNERNLSDENQDKEGVNRGLAKKFNFEETKSRIRKDDRYYPVITLVLYLGTGHWKGRTTLREVFSIPEEMERFFHDKIQNYTFSLAEADYVDPEDFQTDLRQFFKAMQCRKDKQKLKELFAGEEFQNLRQDAQKMICVHLGIKQLTKKVVEEEENMCKAYRELIKDERAEAKAEGKAEGRVEGRAEGRAEGEVAGRAAGRAEGEISGMLKIITDYANQTKCSIERAMELLMVSEENKKRLLSNK